MWQLNKYKIWNSLAQIIGDLLQFQGSHKHEFDSRWKSFNLVKKSMENRVSIFTYNSEFILKVYNIDRTT